MDDRQFGSPDEAHNEEIARLYVRVKRLSCVAAMNQ